MLASRSRDLDCKPSAMGKRFMQGAKMRRAPKFGMSERDLQQRGSRAYERGVQQVHCSGARELQRAPRL